MMSNSLTLSAFVPQARLARALFALLLVLGGGPFLAHAGETLTVKAVAQRGPVHPGEQFAVAIVMEFGEGWHAWPNVPVVPDELKGDLDAIPTTIKLAKGQDGKPGAPAVGWTVHETWAQWPTPHEVTTAGLTGAPLTILSYSGTSVAFVPVTLDAAAAVGDVTLTFEVYYQACNESVCQRPTTETATVVVNVAAIGVDGKENQPETFKAFDGSVFATIASGTKPGGSTESGVAGGGKSPQTEGNSAAQGIAPSLFGFQFLNPNSLVGIVVLLLISVLGGAILNLTPCVLPVIPIKILTLSQHAGESRSRAFKLGLWMALGIVAFWLLIGIPMAFLSSAFDPSRFIFGTWWVLFGIGLIITAFGFGIMGLFTINLPQSVYMVNPKADSAWGSFLFGLMTAVLGLPCFGFVAGGLLAGAASLPALAIMAVFVGIGVGMAAPYLILSANPRWVEKIPRTGPASELIKQVMGLLLLAAAAFFISGAIKGLVSGRPYLKESMPWWAVAFFVVVTGIWLTIRTLQISKKSWPKVVMPFLAVLAVISFVGFASSLTTAARVDYERRQATAVADDSIISGAWLSYNPARLKQAQESGKIIVADFTADWCINCKVLKRTFLDRDPVRSAMVNGDVIMLEVDCTNSDAPGWDWLRSLGRTAVPTLVIVGPGMDSPIILNAYTSETVMDALAKARGGIAALPASP